MSPVHCIPEVLRARERLTLTGKTTNGVQHGTNCPSVLVASVVLWESMPRVQSEPHEHATALATSPLTSAHRCCHLYLFQLLQWLASLLSLSCWPAAWSPSAWRLSGRGGWRGRPGAAPCFHIRTLHWKTPQHLPLRWRGRCRGGPGWPGRRCARPGAAAPASGSALNTKDTKRASGTAACSWNHFTWTGSDFKGKLRRWRAPVTDYYTSYFTQSMA